MGVRTELLQHPLRVREEGEVPPGIFQPQKVRARSRMPEQLRCPVIQKETHSPGKTLSVIPLKLRIGFEMAVHSF